MEPRIPHETPATGERSADSAKRTIHMPNFLQSYIEKWRPGQSEESGQESSKDKDSKKESKKETKTSRWVRSNFPKVFRPLYPPPKGVSEDGPLSISEHLRSWDARRQGEAGREATTAEETAQASEAEFSFSGMLADLHLSQQETVASETTIIESETTIMSSEVSTPLEQEDIPEADSPLETDIPPVESVQEIFARQAETEHQITYDRDVGAGAANIPPDQRAATPQTLYERQTVVHRVEHRPRKHEAGPVRSSRPEIRYVAPQEEVVKRQELTKETVIIEKIGPITPESQRPIKREIVKTLKKQEVVRNDHQEQINRQQAERLDQVLKKRFEEDDRRSAEKVLEKTIEAAKQNVAIESLYEKRHETRGGVDDSKLTSISSSVNPIPFTQQVNTPYDVKNISIPSQQPSTKEKPTKTPDLYKQAAASGFWLALLLIIIFAFAVILIR